MDRRPLLSKNCTRHDGVHDETETAGAPDDEDEYVLTAYEYPRLDRDGDSYRRERGYGAPKVYRYYTEVRVERRHTSTTIAKLFLFCTIMIFFCVLMYIPVYSKVNTKLATVSGWTANSNRDTRVYVQPGNRTLIHDVKNVCPSAQSGHSGASKPLFLLIIVCSSTVNFKERQVIRETWANYSNFLEITKANNVIRERYKNYKPSQDLDEFDKAFDPPGDGIHVMENPQASDNNLDENVDNTVSKKRRKRSISNFEALIPHLATILKNSLQKEKNEDEITEEPRFEDISEQKVLPEFEMDKVLGEERSEEVDYDEESNVMKIPPRGFEDTPDLSRVISMLKKADVFKANGSNPVSDSDNKVDSRKNLDPQKESTDQFPVYKVLFLLGLPYGENDTEIQSDIDDEASRYGDILQENFIDSYNNLTLKSIMMLKWIVTHCDQRVRYVLKTDDDVYVNVPRLVRTIEARAEKHRRTHAPSDREHYIAGHLIRNARPVSDARSKWYAPQYMYAGRIYPRYLSGTGYVLTGSAVAPLYLAALKTPLFHMEDIFITGMCAARAVPRIWPSSADGFAYTVGGTADQVCDVYVKNTVHRAGAALMRTLARNLGDVATVKRCERRLLQIQRTHELARLKKNAGSGMRARLAKLSHFRNVVFT